jgi:hypothetical protein
VGEHRAGPRAELQYAPGQAENEAGAVRRGAPGVHDRDGTGERRGEVRMLEGLGHPLDSCAFTLSGIEVCAMRECSAVLEQFWPTRRQNAFDEWCPSARTAAL